MAGEGARQLLNTVDSVIASPAGSNLFFEAVEAAYNEAVQHRPAVDRYYRLAGSTVRLSFAGNALESILTPALAHIECDPVEAPDLTILCWDDASAGVSTPEPPTTPGHAGTDFVDGSVRIAWEPARRSLLLYDSTRARGLMRFADADSAAVWEPAAPCLRMLHWWAAGLGMQVVHAAAVGFSTGGVLLVGRGGSGKSTTALACIGSPLGYAADDYCLISFDDAPRVHSVYSTGKADIASVRLLPSLSKAFAASEERIDGKRVVFGAASFASALIHSFPLRAVVVPKVGAAGPALTRIGAAHALRMVAPSTMMQLPGDRASSLARLARIVGSVPCYELSIGPDPYSAIPALESLSRGEIA
jgi:hypothetical protein